jgi:hypothetical protein
MKAYLRIVLFSFGTVMGGLLFVQERGIGDSTVATDQTSPSPAPVIDNPTPSGPTPTGVPPPINDPAQGSSQGNPGNTVPLLVPVNSSGTVTGAGSDGSGTSH